MGFLPGWDSADTTAAIAHNLHITAIVVLGLLFLSEGLALMYDSRKEHLVGIATLTAEAKRKRDEDDAEARRKTDVEALQKRLAEADKKVAGLQSQNVARRLSDSDKQALIRDLSNSPGQKAQIMCVTNSWDCADYAKDFVFVFEQAKWSLAASPIVYGMVMGHDVVGVEILINPAVVSEPQKVPGDFADSINYLARALTRLGQMPTETVTQEPSVKYGELTLRIGRIPTPK
jgi:hypothetical protein